MRISLNHRGRRLPRGDDDNAQNNDARRPEDAGRQLFAVGLFSGETNRFDLAGISSRSAWAFAYLTVIGSLIGFTAFSWLLKVSTPARISTYAYVNPVIAVFLGWAIGEKLTARILWAAGVIVLGVVVITTGKSARATDERNAVGTCNAELKGVSKCVE